MTNRNNNIIKITWSWCLIVLSSLIAGILILCDFDKPVHYNSLSLLPFSFALINMLSIGVYKNIYKNIGLVLVIGLYYCRLVLVPLLMSFGGYESILKINITQNLSGTVVLIIYELIVVYLVINWIILNNKIHLTLKRKYISPKNKTVKFKFFGVLVSVIVLFDIAVFISIPESRELYTNLFNNLQKTNSEIVSINTITNSGGGLKRAFLTLYTMSIEIIRIFIPAYFIYILRKKFGENIKGILLSIPFILLQLLLVSNTHARTLMCAFVLMILLTKLYPTWSTKLYKVSIISSILFIVFYFVSKFNSPTSDSFQRGLPEGISRIMNAYFSGQDNIAATFNVIDEQKGLSLFYNLYYSIPFNGSLFGLNGQTFQSLYNNANGTTGQISPLIGEGYYYLGALLAPLLSVILVIFAIYYGGKAEVEHSLWRYLTYVYLTILLAMSIIMYNMEIFISTLNSLILPMIILSNLASNKKFTLNPKKL